MTVFNLPFSTSVDYTTRLKTLNLLPICYWHELLYGVRSPPIFMFFIFKHVYVIDVGKFMLNSKSNVSNSASFQDLAFFLNSSSEFQVKCDIHM